MKFTLIVNEQQKDGFKLSVDANTENELRIAEELTKALIAKIDKITVWVTNYV